VFATGVAFNPANNKLYLPAQVNGHVRVIDADTFAQANIPVGGCPTGIDVNPITNKIYISSQCYGGNDKLFVIDGATHAVAGPYDLNGITGSVMDVTVNPATNRVYAPAGTACSNIKTRVFNGADNSRLTDLPNIGVHGVDPLHNRVFAVGIDPGDCHATDLRVLDGNTHAVVTTINVPGVLESGGVIVSNPDLDRLYFSIGNADQLVVLDATTYAEVARVHVADGPSAPSVDRASGRVYIPHNDTVRQISVLEEAPEEFYDPFDSSTLDPAWQISPGYGSYSLTERPGYLRYHAAPPSAPAPRYTLFRRFRGDNWTFQTNVSYTVPIYTGRQLLTFITFGSPDAWGGANGVRFWRDRDFDSRNRILVDFIDNSVWFPGSDIPLPGVTSSTHFFRIIRCGRTVTVGLSGDGVTFDEVGAHTFGSQIEGLTQHLVISGNDFALSNSFADYDYVRLTKGQPNQPPVASAGPSQAQELSGSSHASLMLDGSLSTDPDGDPLTYTWTGPFPEGGGTIEGVSPTITLPVGTHAITLTVSDGKGGTSTASVIVTISDPTPPLITPILEGSAGNDGWYRSDVAVNWEVSDPESGIVTKTGCDPITLSSETAGQTLTCSATNGAGLSTSASVTVKIDKTPPAVTFGTASPAPNAAGWNNTKVSVPFTAADDLSGVASTDPASPLQLTAEGAAVGGSVTATDLAGNSATFTSPQLKIDKTPPSISGSRSPAANSDGWNNGNVVVSFSCTDTLSRLAAGSPPPDTVVSSEGANQSNSGSCQDAAGNSASAMVGGINIDKTPPSVTGMANRAPDSEGWYNHTLTVTWSGTDALSGISDCDAASNYDGPDSATGSVSGSCRDKAGNVGNGSLNFKFDKTLPVITITVPLANYNLLQREQVAASYACTDALSGVKSLSGPVSNGANVDSSTLGDHNFMVTCTDNAGNIATLTRVYKVITLAGGIGQTVDIVNGMNLAQGIENSLDAKLSNAQQAMEASNAGQRQDAINKLNAVISATEAQRGKQLTSEQADQIIAQVRRIMTLL